MEVERRRVRVSQTGFLEDEEYSLVTGTLVVGLMISINHSLAAALESSLVDFGGGIGSVLAFK